MTNASTYRENFAQVLACTGKRVELSYNLDSQVWPWLALPPHHPVLVEKYQYFGTVTASWAMQLFTPETYTALTRFYWQCTPAAFSGKYATHGVCNTQNGEAGLGFSLDVGTADGCVMFRSGGEGFAFEDRDYRDFRARARSAVAAANHAISVQVAAPEMLGLGPGAQAFVGPSTRPECVHACVTKQGGFVPVHAFHTGSGDHVNAAQLLDCALQAAHWFIGEGQPWQRPLLCQGGEAGFQRYVELDVPFTISLVELEADLNVHLKVSQAGKDNAVIALKLVRGEDGQVHAG